MPSMTKPVVGVIGSAHVVNDRHTFGDRTFTRAEIEQERLATSIKNLKDSRSQLLAEFKAALGLNAADAMPPVPAKF